MALGDANRYRIPPEAGDVALATGEWSFISALGHNLLFPLRNGVTGVILEGRPASERVLAADIRAALKDRIAPYKVPHIVEFTDALPKSPVGKVLRRELIG